MTDIVLKKAGKIPTVVNLVPADKVLVEVGGEARRAGPAAVRDWLDLASQSLETGGTAIQLLASTAQGKGEGTYYRTVEGFTYREASASATDHHVATAGGVKLYVLPGADGWLSFAAFGLAPGADASALLKTALAAGPVDLCGGSFKIAVSLVVTSTARLRNGTLSVTTASVPGVSFSGALSEIEGVTFDGNNVANRIPTLSSAWVRLTRVTIKNVFQSNGGGSTGVAGASLSNVSRFLIEDCTFQAIGAPSEGTVVGEGQGAVRGLYIFGFAEGVVSNCLFSDINSRAAPGGALQFTRADGLSTQTETGVQRIKVLDNRFLNCGKRAGKFNPQNAGDTNTATSSACVYEFSGNLVTSSYTNTPDDGADLTNGMYAAVSCYGGRFRAKGNNVDGGPVGYFWSGGGAGLHSVEITGNEHHCEYHRYSDGQQTTFAFCEGNGLAAGGVLTVQNNRFSGMQFGVRSRAARVVIANNPLMSCAWDAFEDLSGGAVTFTGNNVPQDSNGGAVTYGSAVKLHTGTTALTYDGNTVEGKFDALTLPSGMTAAPVLRVGVNVHRGVVRALIRPNGQQALIGTATGEGVQLLANGTLTGGASGTPGTAPTNWTATGTAATITKGTGSNGSDSVRVQTSGAAHHFMQQQTIRARSPRVFSAQLTVTTGVAVGEILNSRNGPAGATYTYRVNGATVGSSSVVPTGSVVVELVITGGAVDGSIDLRWGVGANGGAVTGDITFEQVMFENGSTRSGFPGNPGF